MIQEDEEATRMLWFVHNILLLLVVAAGQGGSWFECLYETGGKIIIVIFQKNSPGPVSRVVDRLRWAIKCYVH